MKVCSNCGHLLADDVRFCDSCGHPVAEQPIENPRYEEASAEQTTGTYFTPLQAEQTLEHSSAPQPQNYTPPQPQASTQQGAYYTPPQSAPAGTFYTPNQQPQQAYNPYQYQQNASYQPVETKASTGLAVLSFFIPLVGIIIYFADKKTRPLTARKSLKCALISIVLQFVLAIISVVAISLFSVNYMSKHSDELQDFEQQFEQQLEDQFGEDFAREFEQQFEEQFGEQSGDFDFDSFVESQQNGDAQN